MDNIIGPAEPMSAFWLSTGGLWWYTYVWKFSLISPCQRYYTPIKSPCGALWLEGGGRWLRIASGCHRTKIISIERKSIMSTIIHPTWLIYLKMCRLEETHKNSYMSLPANFVAADRLASTGHITWRTESGMGVLKKKSKQQKVRTNVEVRCHG